MKEGMPRTLAFMFVKIAYTDPGVSQERVCCEQNVQDYPTHQALPGPLAVTRTLRSVGRWQNRAGKPHGNKKSRLDELTPSFVDRHLTQLDTSQSLDRRETPI